MRCRKGQRLLRILRTARGCPISLASLFFHSIFLKKIATLGVVKLGHQLFDQVLSCIALVCKLNLKAVLACVKKYRLQIVV